MSPAPPTRRRYQIGQSTLFVVMSLPPIPSGRQATAATRVPGRQEIYIGRPSAAKQAAGDEDPLTDRALRCSRLSVF